ncbi:Bidirectional sugar transporter SWEET7 [Striga hermonthica]|uniref:Bidirectional sugar transporter SWEET n=1 Tax=Striga hermonthica TaxID=68872 RepID=A0A9N7NUT4_STRHE|nr:Bidirectional sugar transporter SWEET7 [Striga hermonthica]
MFSKDDARTIVGIIGNIIALVLFLSPVPTFIGIWKKKSVDEYSAVPYLATLVNCGLWVLYGLPIVHPHSMLVVTINGTGLLIEIVYISIFLAFSKQPGKRLRVAAAVAAECVFLGALALLVLTLTHSTSTRSHIIGTLSMVANIIMYASPLSIMKLVITTKSVEYMPFFLSLFSFLNGISWTAYALIRFDIFLVIHGGGGLPGLELCSRAVKKKVLRTMEEDCCREGGAVLALLEKKVCRGEEELEQVASVDAFCTLVSTTVKGVEAASLPAVYRHDTSLGLAIG